MEDTISGFLIGIAVSIATNNSMQTLFLYTTDRSDASQVGDVESQEDIPSPTSGLIKKYMFQSSLYRLWFVLFFSNFFVYQTAPPAFLRFKVVWGPARVQLRKEAKHQT